MSEYRLELRRVLSASIERVWEAWIDPRQIMQWKAPEGMETPEAEVDLSVGGKYMIRMVGGHVEEPNGIVVRGVFKEIDKPNKLVFSWKWDGQEEESLVSVSLKKISESQTELTLVHSGFETEKSMGEHNKGWESTVNKLENFLQNN